MALLPILHFPDPRLRERALDVESFDAALEATIADMFETMYAAPGIGLAATQLGIARRIAVIDVSEDKSEPRVLVNPRLIESSGRRESEEGCLSVPGYYDTIERAERLRVRALGRDGEPFELEAEDLLAVCIQHELDHLNGQLFIDHLSDLKRRRLRRQIEKARREARAEETGPAAG
ncbi:MAG TPA: peptide deformylase [Gammaproteobacteria bacterium]|nr:peptide deformylase [Gammaproteobacteria bacterium]